MTDDPGKRLTPEESALLAKLQHRQQGGFFSRGTKNVMILLFAAFFGLTIYSATRPFIAAPLYADCVRLHSPETGGVAKLRIVASYFPKGPRCRIDTGHFSVHKIFQQGTERAQLVLNINRYGFYEMDGINFLNALVPDREALPPGPAAMAVMELAHAVENIGAGQVDVPRLLNLLRNSGGLAFYAGENAEIIKMNLLHMQKEERLEKGAFTVPPWLDGLIALKHFKPKRDPRVAPEAPMFGSGGNFHPRQVLHWLKNLGRMGQ